MAKYIGLRDHIINFIKKHKRENNCCPTMTQLDAKLEELSLTPEYQTTTKKKLKSYLIVKYFKPIKLNPIKKENRYYCKFYFVRINQLHNNGDKTVYVDLID
jgi:hypothetical protein